MTGFRGLLFTSASGAKFTWTPIARASTAVIRASSLTSRAAASPAIAPIAICRGNTVAPLMRKPTPASKSAVFNNGTDESACSRFTRDAAENGCPRMTVPYEGLRRTGGAAIDAPNTWKPPT